MIKTLIKRKAESSGWGDAITQKEKEELLDYWKITYGITLDPSVIAENVGMHSLIKMFLVSLWGKFA